MKKYFNLLALIVVFILTSCASQQRYPDRQGNYPYGNRDDNRYGNRNDGRYSNNSNWIALGNKRVSSRSSSEKININSRAGWLQQLRFDASGPVNIYRCVVRYDDGRTEEIRVRNSYNNNRSARGNNSVVVDLPNRNRTIRQVIFWYDSGNYSRNNAVVTVYGR